MLNSASTIFTMDLYDEHFVSEASDSHLVVVGRVMTVVFVIVGSILAPYLADPRFKGVFNFIQEFQGYISPGILAAFLIGFIVKRAPAAAGVGALLGSAPVYGVLQWQWGEVHFLLRMALTFAVLTALMLLLTAWRPLDEPRTMPVREDLDTSSSLLVRVCGGLVIAGVVLFFIVFW
jgi:SSS family solute:Na+ symporter